MRPKPVEKAKKPRYPTREAVLLNPRILERHLPPGWRVTREIAATTSLFMAAGLSACGGEVVAEEGEAKKKKAIALVAPIFEHGDGRYRVVETWRGRGLYSLAGEIVRSSRGNVGPGGLRPLEFTDERSRRIPARASFDWSANTLVLQRKGETRMEPMPPEAQDRVSFLLALALSPPRRRPATFSVTDGGGVSRYVFEAIGREQLKVPAGEFDALKIVRRPEDAGDRRVTEIWLARALGWLPVRILLVENDGTRLDQQAVAVTIP